MTPTEQIQLLRRALERAEHALLHCEALLHEDADLRPDIKDVRAALAATEPTPPTGEAPEEEPYIKPERRCPLCGETMSVCLDRWRKEQAERIGARPKPTDAPCDVCGKPGSEHKGVDCILKWMETREPTDAAKCECEHEQLHDWDCTARTNDGEG